MVQPDPTRRPEVALVRSAGAVEASARQLSDSADRRNELAADRTLLAAERTYAAWMRTALAALASGVGARALLGDVIGLTMARITGSVLILFAGFCLVAAVWRQVRDDVPPPRAGLRPLPHLALVAVNGFLLLTSLATLVGIWA